MGCGGPTLRLQGLQGHMVPTPPAGSLEAQGAQSTGEGISGTKRRGRRVVCMRAMVREVQAGLRDKVQAVGAVICQGQGVRT